MGRALPASPPAIVAPGPDAGAQAKPFILAQLEPPPGPIRVEPPPPRPGEKPGTTAKPGGVRRIPFLGPELDIDLIRTPDIDLLYFAPAETYLTPYVGRSLENALAFQKRFYGWTPW